jgi:hypothetical protein
LQGTGTKDAQAAVAQIMNAAVKFLGFLGFGNRSMTRPQTSRMHFEHLRKPLMQASFSIWKIGHSTTSCLKSLSAQILQWN